MDQIERELLEALGSSSAFEMANVSKEDTGLPYDLWIDSAGDFRKRHGPRIKVQVNNTLIPITISDNPDIPKSAKKGGISNFPHLAEIKKYIKAYKEILLAHYKKQLSDKNTLLLLETLGQADINKIKLVNYLKKK